MAEDQKERTVEVTPEMVEAARVALIAWYEGARDFADGARSVLEAGMAARRKSVEFKSRPL